MYNVLSFENKFSRYGGKIEYKGGVMCKKNKKFK